MNKLIGFENEFNYLFNNLKNKTLSSSLLISGNKGIGKFFFISNLIKEFIKINSINNINHHLSLFVNNTHPNIKILVKELDDKSKKIKKFITIDQVRKLNFFSRETSIIENFPKFIIIDSADDLNINSSNALLKILEEPKKNTYFFLISHLPSLLLPTIKSRCLKINLPLHDFSTFNNILKSQNLIHDEEIIKFLFDITNGSPGLFKDYDCEEILDIFQKLTNSIVYFDSFSDDNNILIETIANFSNDKFKIYLSIIKFILISLNKIKCGININDHYLSRNIKKIFNISEDISTETIYNKLEYLIINENDLFTFNLDKKIFMINFFAVT